MTQLIGRQIGRYQVQDAIGRGGMARVYKAFDTSLRRPVALKVLAPQLSMDPEFIRRFQREAVTAANLRHPAIVTVYDVGEIDGYYYIAMELVHGLALQTLLRRCGGLGLPFTLAILEPLSQALDYAHGRGVIHRDLKPHNVLVDLDGRVLLTDFGIVQLSDPSEERLTRTGMFMGTPEYISPEQARGEPVDRRSDLYSLGILAYETLTGRVPFAGATPQLIVAHANNLPPPPSLIDNSLPAELDDILERSLAKQPEQRYATAAAFVEALRTVAQARQLAPVDSTQIATLARQVHAEVELAESTAAANPAPDLPPPSSSLPPTMRGPTTPAGLLGSETIGGSTVLIQANESNGSPLATDTEPSASEPRRSAAWLPIVLGGIVLVLALLIWQVVTAPSASPTPLPVATQAPATVVVPTDAPLVPTDAPLVPTDTLGEPTIAPTDVPLPTNAPPTVRPQDPTRAPVPTTAPVPTEVPATEVPPTNVPATEVPATEVPATEVPPTEPALSPYPISNELPTSQAAVPTPTATDEPTQEPTVSSGPVDIPLPINDNPEPLPTAPPLPPLPTPPPA